MDASLLFKESEIKKFHPADGQILCEAVEESEQIGSIIIPDSARVPLTQGIVIEAGDGCDPDKNCKGRLIIFRLHTENRINIGGEEYFTVEPINVILYGPVIEQK